MYKQRRATSEDLLYLIDIDMKCNDPYWRREQWEQLLSTHMVFVSTWWGKPVGFAVLRLFPKVSHVIGCAVKERHRRNGLGGKLLKACTNLSISHGCHTLSCVVPEPLIYPGAGALGSFLNSAGFKAEGIIHQHIQLAGETVDAVRFLKRFKCPA